MSILVTKYVPIAFNHSQEIPQKGFQQAKADLQGIVLNPKLGYGKNQPWGVRQEIHQAKVQLAHLGKTLKSKNADSETIKKEIVAKALSFNKTDVIDGKTSIRPIGLMALSRLNHCISKSTLKEAKILAADKTVDCLQQEYMKQQLLKAAPKKQPVPIIPTIIKEKPISVTEDAKVEIKTASQIETAPSKVETTTEIANESIIQEVADTPLTGSSNSTQEIHLEEIEVKAPEIEKKRRPKRARHEETTSTLSFWQKFVNLFKTIFEWIGRLFTGNKKEENQ